MQALVLTIFLSSLLAAGFVAFFLHLGSGERSDSSRDPLLPLRDDSGPAQQQPAKPSSDKAPPVSSVSPK